jgi:4-aminobutyrate aminotransferase-like enzyme
MSMQTSETPRAAADATALMERRRRAMGPVYATFYDEPLHLVRGEGVWLEGADGRRYLDAYNNVPSVGHCHPRVVAALSRQAARLNTHTRYLTGPVVGLAEKLLATLPAPLAHAMFTCSGSESNDLALRIAMEASGGTGVVITRFAYHGNSLATVELSPAERGVQVPERHRLVDAPDTFTDGGKGARDFAGSVARAFADMVAKGIRPAALLIDSAFSSDGIYFPEQAAIQGAVDAARAAGAVIIADEVQSGFARLGDAMWGFQLHGFRPDIVTMGKPMGAGHPVGCVVVTPEVVAPFTARFGYFNTFGGNPVSAAAAGAVLDVIADEGLQRNAREVGGHVETLLRQVAARHPAMVDVRCRGLYTGVELWRDGRPDGGLGRQVMNEMRRLGVLISLSGPDGNILKIRPPLPFSRSNAEQLAETLARAMSTVRH